MKRIFGQPRLMCGVIRIYYYKFLKETQAYVKKFDEKM